MLGEGLRTLDLRRLLGRAEAGDPGVPDGVGDPGHQRHLGADDDQVGAPLGGQRGDGDRVGGVDARRAAAITAVPALPGAQASAVTAGSDCRATHRACSRAPEPITRTRTRPNLPTRRVPGSAAGLGPGGTQLPVEGAHPGVLLGPGPGVGPQLLPVRLGLQLPPGGQPRRVQLAAVDRGGDRAARARCGARSRGTGSPAPSRRRRRRRCPARRRRAAPARACPGCR